MDRSVAIVGAAGKMGQWFSRYFAKRSPVVVFDKRKVPETAGVKVADSLQDCVKDADVVFVCVPVQKTAQTVKKCSKEMKRGAVLAEISSVKSKTFSAMKNTRQDLKPVCIHPMFGPGAGEQGIKMLLVPVRSKPAELGLIKDLFSGADIIEMADAKSHDRAIAVVLGLTYLLNISYSQVLSKEDLPMLKRVGGTTFSLQSMLCESVMTDEPELMAALLKDNPYVGRYAKTFIDSASAISRLSGRKLDKKLSKAKSDIQDKADISASYRQMYKLLDSMKK
jgi:prephenate dehydrogenase